MDEFNHDLAGRLAELQKQDLLRELKRVDSPQSPRIQVAGRELLNFSSNDYLGLANSPVLKEAAIKAVEQYGAGAGASRLISGSLQVHHQLEEALAEFKGVEAALSFSSGFAAAIGTIPSLMGRNDFVVIDKLVHASLVDAARMCGATLRVFAHNDMEDLEKILQWTARKSATATGAQRPRTLIVTESVFSMEGDHAPLRRLLELKEKFGAWLMLDEAHATGLYGPRRRGLAEELAPGATIEVQMGTLGKALGSSGGYICGSRQLIDFLLNRARSFVFSTAPVPAAAAAAEAAVRLVQSAQGEEARARLWRNEASLPTRFKTFNEPFRSAIIPVLTGGEALAIQASAQLRERGVFVPAVRYPTVPRGKARLRLTLSAAHSETDISRLVSALDAAELVPQNATDASPRKT